MKLNKLHLGVASLAILATAGVTAPVNAQENYIGEIMWTGFTFCPRGTIDASGQLLAISSNTALFSLYGTTYGGDGRTTFKLPDLRSRAPMHFGQGPGLTNRPLGQSAGTETNTMTVQQMPSHNHAATSTSNSSSTTTLRASSATGNTADPEGNVLADGRTARVYRDGTANV
ncbi:phage tail protein, partial [Hyphococcus sp.]|uniref:phage tail protein n=1 Tax=Hyphococcus sp. TaxID=2038636 RepID=UPI003751EDBA